MTAAPLATSEMDHLDQLGAKAFDGFLVRKDLVHQYFRQFPVPTDVVEFLLGRYCASTDPAEIEEGIPSHLCGTGWLTARRPASTAISFDRGSPRPQARGPRPRGVRPDPAGLPKSVRRWS